MASMLDAALGYAAQGLHAIPCEPRGKRPLVKWQEYQSRKPDDGEITAWWTVNPDANIALVVGRGILVVDLDGLGADLLLTANGIELPDAPMVRTGNGRHVYLAPDVEVRNRAALFATRNGGPKAQVDIRADGGYVLAPPSIHPNGTPYAWLRPLAFPLPAIPEKLREALRERKQEQPRDDGISGPGWVAKALRGVPEGLRDDTAARLAGYFLGRDLPRDVVVALLDGFAERCSPPLAMRDVLRIVDSIARADARKESVDRAVSVEHIGVSVARALDEMQRPRTGVPTPFSALNHLIAGGIQPGELVYLGARPGVGKTAMALEIARAAAKAGKRVLIVSREMLSAALSRRMIAQEGRIDATQMKLGNADMGLASMAGERLAGLGIWVTDSARSLEEVRTGIDAVPGGINLLIVDYLQLMQAPRQIRERRLQVEHVSQGLKALALERAVPVVCLSSLSRPPSGTNPEPTLASLRESGELEHDADIVVFLHRELKDSPKTLCIVAKNRDGSTGVARLVFKPEWVSFAEMEMRYGDEAVDL